jgi:ubiquinone/menaquinone biosynthesis C-methylase UbiE
MTVQFEWEKNEIMDLLATCEKDGLLPYILRNIKKDDRILESGCGLARWVKKLHDMEYSCYGMEYSESTVNTVREVWPELDIIVGNVLYHPFKDNSFDAIISLGVVEHFEEGPHNVLSDIFRILQPGGIGIITVPCFNWIRKIKHPFSFRKYAISLHQGETISRKKKFFEYRFTPEYFSSIVQSTGFEIIEQQPFALIDGFYHDLDPLHFFVKFERWKFNPEDIWINRVFSKIPYFHPHMQILIVRKPKNSENKNGQV